SVVPKHLEAKAEQLLQENGDFLIRDSVSSVGDYVLSCAYSGQALHFKIIAITLRPKRGHSRTLYQLEQDQFDNIPALVRSYVGDKKMVSESSRAVIVRPVNRTLPLRAIQERHHTQTVTKDHRKSLLLPDSTVIGDVSGSMQEQTPVPLSPMFRTGSDPVLRAKAIPAPTMDLDGNNALRGSDSQLHSKAPPKPIRAPSILIPESSESSDTYCELVPRVDHSAPKHPGPTLSHSNVIPEEGDGFIRPQIQNTSSYQPQHFQSILLSPENKPLEAVALHKLKEIVSHRDCKESAFHILKEDCQVCQFTPLYSVQQNIMGVQSGLELLTLPYGQQFRRDLLERHHLLSLGVAVDILGCTGAVTERAHTLHRIIQLAVELRDHVGDLFAFSAVMKALMLPQVTRLEQTWQMLRQSHTQSAISFQKQLKPFLKELDECVDVPPVDNVVVPHILPVLKALEGEEDWAGPVEDSCGRLLRVLKAARSYAANSDMYRSNAESKLTGFQPIPELREAFQTEFSLRLFWGSKGAAVDQSERYKKFDKILSVLSYKLEPETDNRRTTYGTIH
uniref:SH2 domain-containing protein 3C n=1 Tax=Leptobrachium leishanense TaxID=445787 RepID=A0A8C5QR86_9ANUR